MKQLKQGINHLMRVGIDMDLDLVRKIVFKCSQKDIEQIWEYPSATAVRIPDKNEIDLKWTWEDTFKFKPEAKIIMDTKIFLESSECNPPTKKVEFIMDATTFTEEEMGDIDG